MATLNEQLQNLDAIIKDCADEIGRCEAWFDARDEYVKLSHSGDDDWSRWDDEANSAALVAIQKAGSLHEVRCIIDALIWKAARGHATQCERNGWLDDDPTDYAGMGWVGRDGRP